MSLQGLEFDTVVLADDFVEVTEIPWSIRGGKAQPVWSSRTDIEEVTSDSLEQMPVNQP